MSTETRMVEVPADVWARAMKELREIRANQASTSAHISQVLGELTDYSVQPAAVRAGEEMKAEERLVPALRSLIQRYEEDERKLQGWSSRGDHDAGNTEGQLWVYGYVLSDLRRALRGCGAGVE